MGARPLTRGECSDAARPCAWDTCRYHEVRLSSRCALDVADNGPRARAELSALLGVDRGALGELERRALAKVRRRLELADRRALTLAGAQSSPVRGEAPPRSPGAHTPPRAGRGEGRSEDELDEGFAVPNHEPPDIAPPTGMPDDPYGGTGDLDPYGGALPWGRE